MTTRTPSGVITITTDFGLADGNVAAMKGVIWTLNPEARIADISHLIAPQNVMGGSRLVSKRVAYFPHGTVHIVVVDPGVGTARRPLAVRWGSQFFVGPDNGLVTPLLEMAGNDWEAVELTERRFWLPRVSNVFHGRDIFAPVAAHLSAGVPLQELGQPVTDPVLLDMPVPSTQPDGSIGGQIAEIDYFGNLLTNIPAELVAPLGGHLIVSIGDAEVDGLYATFGERAPGELVALIDSSDNLAVAVVNGSAAKRLGASTGQPVVVRGK